MHLFSVLILLGGTVATPIKARQASESFKLYCRVLPNLIALNNFPQNLPLVAGGGSFYLDGGTYSTNPDNPTVLVGSPDACGLDVGVPGG